jgi:putative tricarboxylic transport membrane protein
MLVAGVAGWLMRKARFEAAPLIVAFVLGTMFESSLHQSLAMGYGSAWILIERPVSATLLGIAALVVAASIAASIVAARRPTV